MYPKKTRSLALDLVVSRASLAAMKAKANVPLKEEEVVAVARLRDTLREELAEGSTLGHIPQELVPGDDMRHQLEEALGTLPSVSRGLPVESPELLKRLVATLDRLAERGFLPREEAASLLTGLLQLGSSSGEVPRLVEDDLVYMDASPR